MYIYNYIYICWIRYANTSGIIVHPRIPDFWKRYADTAHNGSPNGSPSRLQEAFGSPKVVLDIERLGFLGWLDDLPLPQRAV